MEKGKGLNKVMLIGWVDGVPEMRITPNGRPVTTFTIVVPRLWTSGDGERHEENEWFNIVAWNSLAELTGSQLGEDQQVYVEGRLQTRRWQDNNGRQHFRTEVVAQEVIFLSNNDSDFWG
jgi:single-strand DNA-binding protein